MKVAFFDLDGTLYDKSGLVKRMIRRALLHGGPYGPFRCLHLLRLERRTRHSLAGIDTGTIGYDTLFALMSEHCSYSVEEIGKWYDTWYMKAMVEELREHYEPNRKVIAFADTLKKDGYTLAVLSDYGCIEAKLEALGIHPEMFAALLDSPSLGGYKPASSVFRAACGVFAAEPIDCIMVGDRADIDGGCTALGMKFVSVEEIADGKQ